jgi:hypothetical protein
MTKRKRLLTLDTSWSSLWQRQSRVYRRGLFVQVHTKLRLSCLSGRLLWRFALLHRKAKVRAPVPQFWSSSISVVLWPKLIPSKPKSSLSLQVTHLPPLPTQTQTLSFHLVLHWQPFQHLNFPWPFPNKNLSKFCVWIRNRRIERLLHFEKACNTICSSVCLLCLYACTSKLFVCSYILSVHITYLQDCHSDHKSFYIACLNGVGIQ